MAGRRLSADDRAVWGRVAATVRPLHPPLADDPPIRVTGAVKRANALHPLLPPPVSRPAQGGLRAANTLDAGWDKRIAKGGIAPDFTIDLHGETLASAHARLNRSLAAAVRQQARVILLITGKPAQDNPRLPPTSRGVIRASVKDWLAASSYAGQIAAIRNAHPRHGGNGALYLILRRSR